jgi:hypothetical protein
MDSKELTIMKNKIFELLNGATNLNEFENWLYSNQFINENVNDNSVVSEFLEINLRSKDWFYEIQKFAKNKYNWEEFIASLLIYNLEKFIVSKNYETAVKGLKNILKFSNWDYDLFSQFDGLLYELINEWTYRIEIQPTILLQLEKLSKIVISSIKENENLDEFKEILYNGSEYWIN